MSDRKPNDDEIYYVLTDEELYAISRKVTIDNIFHIEAYGREVVHETVKRLVSQCPGDYKESDVIEELRKKLIEAENKYHALFKRTKSNKVH